MGMDENTAGSTTRSKPPGTSAQAHGHRPAQLRSSARASMPQSKSSYPSADERLRIGWLEKNEPPQAPFAHRIFRIMTRSLLGSVMGRSVLT